MSINISRKLKPMSSQGGPTPLGDGGEEGKAKKEKEQKISVEQTSAFTTTNVRYTDKAINKATHF